jgi:hypothetical protein
MQVLGSESFLNIPDVNGQFLLVNGGATGTITTGTFASRPAAGIAGNLFVDSTNFVWYYDNGTTWNLLSTGPNPVISGTGSLTLPVGTTAQRPATPTVGMMRYNSTTGYYEAYDTTWQSMPAILDKSTVQLTQTSTTAANLISFSVPANTLGTTGILRFKTGGSYARTAGSGGLTFTISYGGNTIWSGTSGNMATGNTIAWSMELNLIANNSATAQTLVGDIVLDATGNPTTGIGTIGNSNTSPFTATTIAGSCAVASTSAQTFQVTVVSTLATSSLIKYFHTLELL